MQHALAIPSVRRRIRPMLALRGLAAVLRDPEDTAAGARFVLALDGDRGEQNFQRFASDPVGARLLAEDISLRAALSDRKALRALPGDSLGGTYLRFAEEESISAEGLAGKLEPVMTELGALDPVRHFFSERATAMHDLWHVVTGYSRDILGELQLMAFSRVQLRTRAYALLLPLNGFAIERQAPGTRRLLRIARARARRATWLAAADWERLLPHPLDAVRADLRVGPPPAYTRYFHAGRFRIVGEPVDAPRHSLAVL
jgi:ubiquinone biosynthesis protein COQ4